MTVATPAHAPRKSRRLRVVAVSLCAHGLVLFALARAPPVSAPPTDGAAMAISLVDGQALALTVHAAPAKPPPKPQQLDAPPPPLDLTVPPQFIDTDWSPQEFVTEQDPSQDPVAISVGEAASQAGARSCQLTTWLQSALQANADVQADLRTIPRPARSVANAVMIWDGGWVAPRVEAAQGYASLRSALIRGVQAAPADCRAQLVRGPEFMTLGNGPDSFVLAVGSGEWRWGDLLKPSFQFAPMLVDARGGNSVKGSYLAKVRQIFAPLVIH